MRRYPETYPPRNFYVVESGVVLTPSEQQHIPRARYVVTHGGARLVAGRDAEASAINALHRNAEQHAREAERQRPTWQSRRAA